MSEDIVPIRHQKSSRGDAPKQHPQRQPRRYIWVKIFVALLLLGAIGFGTWQYIENQRLRSPAGQQELSQQQVDDTLTKLGKHIILPTDEKPVLRTVSQVEKLKKEQTFFRSAKNGDMVVVYVKNQKAILYREADDIIVNVGPVNINNESETKQSQP